MFELLQWSCTQLIYVQSNTDIVGSDKWGSLWISFDNDTGHLQVGREGETAFMVSSDSDPIQVKYLGYKPYNDKTTFRFCTDGTFFIIP